MVDLKQRQHMNSARIEIPCQRGRVFDRRNYVEERNSAYSCFQPFEATPFVASPSMTLTFRRLMGTGEVSSMTNADISNEGKNGRD